MPLPIKTARRDADGALVQAMLVTPSFTGQDIDNLVGEPVDTTLHIHYPPHPQGVAYLEVTFWGTPQAPRGGLVRHHAELPVPGYLLWDGARLWAVTPRVFAKEYAVVSRVNPVPRVSRFHG